MRTEVLAKGLRVFLSAVALNNPVLAQGADEVREQIYTLEGAGNYAQAADLLEAEFDRLEGLSRDKSHMFHRLAGLITDSGQSEIRIAELTTRLDADPGDSFAAYLLASLHIEREDFAQSALVFHGFALHEPDNYRVVAHFLASCMMAKEECPPLFPDRRSMRPEISCADALAYYSDTFPRVDGEWWNPWSTYWLLRRQKSAWITAANIYNAAYIVVNFRDEKWSNSHAATIILSDHIMRCNADIPGGMQSIELVKQTAEPGQSFYEVYHEEMRENMLDVAWGVKGYDLDFAPQPTLE